MYTNFVCGRSFLSVCVACLWLRTSPHLNSTQLNSLQVADSRKDDMLKNTSPEYVDELSKDLQKWYSASNRGVLRYWTMLYSKYNQQGQGRA